MDILDNFIDLIDATTGSWADNVNSNNTADQARVKAIEASVQIAVAKAAAEQKRKQKLMDLLEVLVYTALAGGILSMIILFALKSRK